MSAGSPVPPPPPPMPPLPPLGSDPHYQPLATQQQQQQQQPIPVQTLGYATAQRRRPGLVTTLGILSIIFAIPAILGGGCIGAYAGIFFMSTGVFTRTANIPATPTPAPTAQAVAEVPDITPEQRQVVIEAMTDVHALSEPRRQLLDVLLAKAGDQIVPSRPQGMTADAVRALVTDAGVTSDGQSDYFLLGRGRIEIDDASARFTSANGAWDTTVTLADAEIPNWQDGLTPEQIEAAIEEVADQVGAHGSGTLTSPQREALAIQFGAPSQSYLAPAPTIEGVKQQISSAFIDMDGGLYVSTSAGTTTGYLQVNATGATTASGTFTAGGFAGGPGAGIPAEVITAVSILALLALVGLALGVLLLVAGIMTLRDAPVARRLHVIYGWVGLVLGIAGTLFVAWTISAFLLDGPYTDPTETMIGLLMIAGTLVAAAGYPLAVLLILRTRTLRDYYTGVT